MSINKMILERVWVHSWDMGEGWRSFDTAEAARAHVAGAYDVGEYDYDVCDEDCCLCASNRRSAELWQETYTPPAHKLPDLLTDAPVGGPAAHHPCCNLYGLPTFADRSCWCSPDEVYGNDPF